MDVEVVSDAAGLAALRDDWVRLEGLNANTPYYVRHHVVTAWWAAHREQPGYELAVLVARNNGVVRGIAPLVTVPGLKEPSERNLRFASHGDYMGFLIDPTDASPHTVCRRLLRGAAGEVRWVRMMLNNVPVDSPLARYLLRSEHNPKFSLHVENPYIDLREHSDFESFADAHMPRQVGKRRRRLLESTGGTFRIFHGADDEIFERMAALHQLERDHLIGEAGRTERRSLFDDSARTEYYRQQYRDGHGLTFGFEDPQGNLLGYRSTLRDDRRLLSWNTAYHPTVADFSMGAVLIHDILEHIFAAGDTDVLDLGAGRYPWKFEWTDTFTSTYKLRMTHPDHRPEKSAASAPKKAPAKAAPRPAPKPAGSDQAAASPTMAATATQAHPATPSPEGTAVGQASPPSAPKAPAAPSAASADPAQRVVRWARRTGGRVKRRARAAIGQHRRDSSLTPRTTYLIAPHPDDETLRTGAFVAWTRVKTDDQIVLVAVSDGGASKAARRRGLSSEQEMSYRRAEQNAAWAALTEGEGSIVRLGLPDGGLTAASVEAELRRALPGLSEPRARVVVAAHPDDYHQDHLAVVEAAKAISPRYLRFALAPLMESSGEVRVYRSPTAAAGRAQVAHHSYTGFGHASVRKEFAAHAEQKFESRVTKP